MKKLKLLFVFVLTLTLCLSISSQEAQAASLKVSSFSVSSGSSTSTGKTIRLSAKASGGFGTKRYKFRYKYGKKTYTIRSYSQTRTTTFQPKKAGTYTLYVYIKDNKKTVVKKRTLKVSTPYTVKLSTSHNYTNEKIKLTASTTGGTGTKYFKFQYKYNGKKYTLRSYSKTRTLYFTPKRVGTYTFYVTSKDAKKKTRTTSKTVKVIDRPLSISASMSANKVITGQSVKMTVSSLGGKGMKQYIFAYRFNGEKTFIISEYSLQNSVTVPLTEDGTYSFIATVKDEEGTKKTITKTVEAYTPVLKIDSFTTSFSSSMSLKKMTLKSSSSGNIGDKVTQFSYIKEGDSERKIIKGYGPKESTTFTPTEYGNYTFYVRVKDSRDQYIYKSKKVDFVPLTLNSGITSATVGTTKRIVKSVASKASLTFTTSNQKVCQVSYTDGYIMPISAGSVTITVTAKLNGSTSKKSFTVKVTDNSSVLVGCDISKWQGTISGSKLKAIGMDYAILRAGHGTEIDTYFTENVKQCVDNKLQFGVYWYSVAQTTTAAKKEADDLIAQLKAAGVTAGKGYFTFPIYYDLEEGEQVKEIGSAKVETITKAFVAELNANGIATSRIGIYANKNWYENYLDRKYYYDTFRNRLWYARYNYPGGNPTFYWNCVNKTMRGQMWQVGNEFRNVSGVSSTYLDLNYYYK